MALHVLRAIARVTEREQGIHARLLGSEGDAMVLPDKLGALAAAATTFRETGSAYALIGGVAVGLRSGVPRATLDVDFAIATAVDLAALGAALGSRGFRQTGAFRHSVNFVHSSGEPVQLAFDAGFDEMIARAELLQLGDLELFVVTRDDLIAMKRRAAADPSGRRSKALRDEADVALLLEQGEPSADAGW